MLIFINKTRYFWKKCWRDNV